MMQLTMHLLVPYSRRVYLDAFTQINAVSGHIMPRDDPIFSQFACALAAGPWRDTLENAKQIPPLLEIIASPLHYILSLFHVLWFLEVSGTAEVGALYLGQELRVLI